MKKMLKLISIIPFVVLVSACSKNNGNIKNVDDKKTDNVELNKKTKGKIKQAYTNSNIYCPEFYQDDNSNIYNITCYGVFGKTAVLASISDEELTKTHIEHWAMDKTFVYTENVNVYLYDNVELSLTDITEAFYLKQINYEDLKQAYSVYEKIHYNSNNDHFLSEITDVDSTETKYIELDDFILNRIFNSICIKLMDDDGFEKTRFNDIKKSVKNGGNQLYCYGIFGNYILLYDWCGGAEYNAFGWFYCYHYDDIPLFFAEARMEVYDYKNNELINIVDYTTKSVRIMEIMQDYFSYEDCLKAYQIHYSIFKEEMLLQLHGSLADKDNPNTANYEVDFSIKRRIEILSEKGYACDSDNNVVRDLQLPGLYQDTKDLNDMVCYGTWRVKGYDTEYFLLSCPSSQDEYSAKSFKFGDYDFTFEKNNVMLVFDAESNVIYLLNNKGEDNIGKFKIDTEIERLYETYTKIFE